MTKRCCKCSEIKGKEFFSKSKSTKDFLRKTCKACDKLYYQKYVSDESNVLKKRAHNRLYRKANLEKVRAGERRYQTSERGRETLRIRKKRFRSKNRERVRQLDKVYKSRRDRSRVRETSNAWARRKYKEDINFRIRLHLRGRINKLITKSQRSGTTGNLLGCSIPELRATLESHFKVGMSWANYGKKGWHIEHHFPLSAFDLTDPIQVKIACNYRNLKPMWWNENLSKGKTIPLGFDLKQLARDWLNLNYTPKEQ